MSDSATAHPHDNEMWVEDVENQEEADTTTEVPANAIEIGAGLEQLQDHLGFDPEMQKYLRAAEFLGKPLDADVVRARLIETDGDVREAVCRAMGLESPEDRQALEAVANLQGLQKSEVPAAKNIQAGLPEGQELAADIREAFSNDEVQAIKLGGKHSAGTLLARDRDGQLYLLKPGSKKQSPAAGVSDEASSQSRREAGFYQVARSWDLESVVPEVQLLLIDGREYAGIKMLPLSWQGLHRTRSQDPNLPRRVLEPYRERGALHRWAALDWVCGSTDRHGQNIMVGPASEGSHVALIDHGSSFAGRGFDPGNDDKTFVPYYLRVWFPGSWSQAQRADKLNGLPVLSTAADDRLREWIMEKDVQGLRRLLESLGIDPGPSVERLEYLRAQLKSAPSASGLINRLWVYSQ